MAYSTSTGGRTASVTPSDGTFKARAAISTFRARRKLSLRSSATPEAARRSPRLHRTYIAILAKAHLNVGDVHRLQSGIDPSKMRSFRRSELCPVELLGVGPSRPRPQLEPIESGDDCRIHVLEKIIAFGGFRVEGQTKFDCSGQIDAEARTSWTTPSSSKTISLLST